MGILYDDLNDPDTITAAEINDRLDTLDLAMVKMIADSGLYDSVIPTATQNNLITAANVIWPDGSAGVFAGVVNSTWLFIESYTVTHVDSGLTITQPTITRGTNGDITNKPQVTVA